MHPTRRASTELSYLLELVLKAMFAIAIVYLVARALLTIMVGPSAAEVVSAVLGIALLFAIVVSERVRTEMLSFGKRKTKTIKKTND